MYFPFFSVSLTDDKREDGCGGRFHDEVLVAQLLDDELAVAVADGGAPRRRRRCGGRLRARSVVHLGQKMSRSDHTILDHTEGK